MAFKLNLSQLANKFTYLLLSGLIIFSATASAQRTLIQGAGNRVKQFSGQRGAGGGGSDSLRHRNKLEDSITINFRYLDSARSYKLDSSIYDFSRRFPVPATHIYLGNTGNAARSLLFSPNLTSGFDPGFHAFDVYKWKLERVRFFNTTRPYSELNYMLGSRTEQIIELLHTQNIKPNWNFSFQYRLINSPGFFKNQKTNHNNYLLTSWFQSMNKRYNNYFVLLSNRLQSSENGGIKNDEKYLDDPVYKDRFNIPTNLGGDNDFTTNFFSTKIGTGNKYNEFTVLLRQQYDLGKKDSLVTDSTVIPLFYPRLRFEHTLQYSQDKYTFQDFVADSAFYKTYYDTAISSAADTFQLKDRWREIVNDFSIYQFPDAKNLQQFIKLGLTVQNLTGVFSSSSSKKSFYNVFGHAEYRNKTRNQKWDFEANGKLYFTGLNAGDYQAYISLQRYAGKKMGYLQLGFENANRTPSFIFDSHSSFYLLHTARDFKKENNTHLFASFYLPFLKFKLSGDYYLLTNYTYISNYYQLQQESSLFNVLRLSLEKTIRLAKHFNWHADVYYQQVIGNAPVNIPVIYTRNRVAYEGNLGFKNLDIALGVEARYHTPYKADGYSPVLGQFFYQDSISINNNLPNIAAYIHFRIKPFKAFIRVENLNTARKMSTGGFGFTNNNLVAPGYPLPGLQFRLGIYWSFVN
ncbi:MAG TPA: putative porin [Chitinophagaceae bacterium]|nr:putative porin [Chitinophagaceae bacterium]